jgi:hypothetical protein
MNLENMDFEELKLNLRKSSSKGLMFLIMMANNELMDRCDKNTLESDNKYQCLTCAVELEHDIKYCSTKCIPKF